MPDSPSATVAILTSPGRGAVAVVAIEGAQALDLVERFFQPAGHPLSERTANCIVFGRWGDQSVDKTQRKIAEDVIVRHAGENQIEVHCHGGRAAAARIVDDLTSQSAVQQTWQQWIASHEYTSIRAAARTALAQATTERTAKILLDQYHGALETELKRIIDILSLTTDSLPTINSAAEAIDQLLLRATIGLHLVKPWRIAILGPPNVGKSSLINALLGYQRSIVFDEPGTTRDLVTASAAFDGWTVELIDTAGIREGGDALEAAGVDLAQRQAAAADCIFLIHDVSQPWNDEIAALLAQWPQSIVVGNKCDLPLPVVEAPRPPFVLTSAINAQGIDELIQSFLQRFIPFQLQPGDTVPFTDDQATALQSAREAIHRENAATAIAILQALLA